MIQEIYRYLSLCGIKGSVWLSLAQSPTIQDIYRYPYVELKTQSGSVPHSTGHLQVSLCGIKGSVWLNPPLYRTSTGISKWKLKRFFHLFVPDSFSLF
jgi:hypothetical protein